MESNNPPSKGDLLVVEKESIVWAKDFSYGIPGYLTLRSGEVLLVLSAIDLKSATEKCSVVECLTSAGDFVIWDFPEMSNKTRIIKNE
jgi:hypothetical protein